VYWPIFLGGRGPEYFDIPRKKLDGSRVYVRSRTKKLEEHCLQGFVKDHLGASRGGNSKQIRMASQCGLA